MFGYIIINKQEMKFREFDVYQSYYCGLCKALQDQYGRRGQMTLSYDMTFLALLLSCLYEPETTCASRRCAAHPRKKHLYRENAFTAYAADMNILLSYEKCLDDWNDDRSHKRKAAAALLKSKNQLVCKKYPEKTARISELMEKIHQCEQSNSQDMDAAAGLFGEIMAEIFVWREDQWAESLRRMGFFLGKFIYLMDAYEDIEADLEKGSYNPMKQIYAEPDFEMHAENILLMMMAECSRAFEKLPIVESIEILRNILYSGVWSRYEVVRQKRKEQKEKQ